MFGVWRVFAMLLLLVNSSAALALVTVGPSGSGCQFTTLQQAINTVLAKERAKNPADPPDVFIGVAGGLAYNEVLNIDSTNITSYPVAFLNTTFDHAFVQIFGDYDGACSNENGSTATIDASNKAGSVMFIHGNQPIEVVLKNLTLANANNTNGAATGGGINFTGQGTLDTTNVTIANNQAQDGAGIYASESGAGLTLKLRSGTVILNNQARGNGGGMNVSGNVALTNLTNLVIDENTAGGNGGGIYLNGAGALRSWTLQNTSIGANTAAFGGGISFASGTLTLGFNTLVEANTATGDGGGIDVGGPARLIAASPLTLVAFNHAPNGRGGGINISGARADIGSPGFNGVPVISFNDALHGGGIAAVAGGNPAAVRLFTTDATQPVAISNNRAQLGGAVYLQQFTSTVRGGADAGLCAYNFRIDSNVASDGSALYGDVNIKNSTTNTADAQDLVFLNINDNNVNPPNGGGGFVCNPEPASALGAVGTCSQGVACNEISGNTSQDGNGNPTSGATVELKNSGSAFPSSFAKLIADRIKIQGNTGARVLRGEAGTEQGNAEITILNSLVTSNTVTRELMSVENLDIESCTLANDVIGAGAVIHSGFLLDIADSIFAEGVVPAIDNIVPPFFSVVFSLSNGSLFPAGPNQFSVVADPQFVNAAAADYHLLPTSPALDLAPASTGPNQLGNGLDLDGHQRAVDLVGIVNGDAVNIRDAGAYELQKLPPACHVADTIFCTGFEAQ